MDGEGRKFRKKIKEEHVCSEEQALEGKATHEFTERDKMLAEVFIDPLCRPLFGITPCIHLTVCSMTSNYGDLKQWFHLLRQLH